MAARTIIAKLTPWLWALDDGSFLMLGHQPQVIDLEASKPFLNGNGDVDVPFGYSSRGTFVTMQQLIDAVEASSNTAGANPYCCAIICSDDVDLRDIELRPGSIELPAQGE